jgi:hypothetical protein
MLYGNRVNIKRGMGYNFEDLAPDFFVLRKNKTFGLRRKAEISST